MQRRTAALLVAAAALLGGAGAFALKEQCNHVAWDDRHLQYWRYCYSDILPLYYRFHLEEDRWPYLLTPEELGGTPDRYTPVEYPVATVGFAYAVAAVTEGKVAYLEVTNALLALCAGLAAWALWGAGADWRRVAFWAAGPAVIVHGTTNWDLLAVALCMGGWWAWARRKPMLAAFLFGLGGAAKLYPAFFLPFLAWDRLFAGRGTTPSEAPASAGAFAAQSVESVTSAKSGDAQRRRPDWRGVVDVAVGAALGFVLPNLLVWRATPGAWLDVWRFHAGRDPDFETAFEAVREGLVAAGAGWPKDEWWKDLVGTGGLVLLAACGLCLAWGVWRRRVGPLAAGGISVILFLLLNRVYSPQYTLWVMPILLALRAPWPATWAFALADLAVFLIRYPLLSQPPGEGEAWQAAHRLAVVLRWAFLAWCLWSVARRHGALPARPGSAAAARAEPPAPADPGREGPGARQE